MCSRSDSCPNDIQASKPAVGGRFIPNAPPDSLLAVKTGLIGRQIIQMKPPMSLQELQNGISPMPAGSVHIQKYPVTSELFIERLQDLEKALPVAFGGSDKTVSAQKRRHPSGDIQPLGMLACGGDFQANAFLSPTSAKAGMERKAGFVLKNNGFSRPQILEFFLKSSRTGGLGSSWPGDTHDRRVSTGTPTDASTSGLDGSSEIFRSSASNEPQASARPIGSWGGQIDSETVPGARLVPDAPLPSSEPAVQDGVWVPGLLNQSRLPHESSGLNSYGLAPGLPLSKRAFGLPKPKGAPRSLFQSRLRESGRPGPPNASGWLRGARAVGVCT